MAQIIIPGRWNRQPQGAVEVDWNNPLTNGLVFAYNGIDLINLVNRQPAIATGVLPIERNNDLSGRFYSPGNTISFSDRNDYTLTGEISIIWNGLFKDVNTSSEIIHKTLSNGGTNTPFDIFADTTVYPQKVKFVRSNTVARAKYLNTTSLVNNKRTTIGILAESNISVNPVGYIDKTLQTIADANTGTGNAISNTKPIVLGIRDDGVINSNTVCFNCAIFSRKLSSQEYFELYVNFWQIFKPIKRQFWSQATNLLSPRYARPIETILNTGWSASTGTDLPAMINEETPNDTNYIYSNTYAATYEGRLEPVEDPSTSTNQVIKYKTRSLYGNTLIAKLKQGSTVIATRTHTNVPSEWTQYSMVLTEAEANSITDYTDLRVHTEIG